MLFWPSTAVIFPPTKRGVKPPPSRSEATALGSDQTPYAVAASLFGALCEVMCCLVEVCHVGEDGILRVEETLARRKALQKLRAVSLGHQALIQAYYAASVALLSDKPAETLFEFDDRLWERIRGKRVAAAVDDRFAPSLDNRIIGSLKRQLYDDHAP